MKQLFNRTMRKEKVCHFAPDPRVLFLHPANRMCQQAARRFRTDVEVLADIQTLFSDIVNAIRRLGVEFQNRPFERPAVGRNTAWAVIRAKCSIPLAFRMKVRTHLLPQSLVCDDSLRVARRVPQAVDDRSLRFAELSERVVDRFGLVGGRPGRLGEGAHAREERFVGEHGPRPSDTPCHAVHVDVQQVVRWPVPSCVVGSGKQREDELVEIPELAEHRVRRCVHHHVGRGPVGLIKAQARNLILLPACSAKPRWISAGAR